MASIVPVSAYILDDQRAGNLNHALQSLSIVVIGADARAAPVIGENLQAG